MERILSFPQASTASGKDYAETDTLRAIHGYLDLVRDHPERAIGIIVGAPGVGKTVALKTYVEEHRSDTHYCEMMPSTATLTTGLRALCEKLGAPDSNRAGVLWKNLIGAASGSPFMQHVYGEKPNLVIIDEAQEMSGQLLQQLRRFPQESFCGLVLCGNETFYKDRIGIKGFEQLASRSLKPLTIRNIEASDLAAYCAHRGVQGARAYQLLERQAIGWGGLRRVAMVVDTARERTSPDKPIGFAEIEAAIEKVGL